VNKVLRTFKVVACLTFFQESEVSVIRCRANSHRWFWGFSKSLWSFE